MSHGMSARAGAALALVAAIGAGPATVGASAAVTSPVTAYILVGTNSNTQFVLPLDTATGKFGAKIQIGSTGSAGTILATPDGQTLYAANTAGVTAIDTSTRQVVATIPLPDGATNEAVTPDGSAVYVTSSQGLYAISTATNKVTATIKVADGSGAIAITPDSKTVYVAAFHRDTVTPVSTATNKPGKPIAVGRKPDNLTMSPDGSTVYVSTGVSPERGYITPISTATNTAGQPIPAGFDSGSFAITPDGKTGYVEGSSSSTITPIDLVTGVKGKAIKVGPSPGDIVILPDGQTAYVPSGSARTVVPVDVATGTAQTPIKEAPSGQVPDFMALTPDAATLYAVNVNGLNTSSVTAISTATNTAGTPAPFKGFPFGIALTP